MNVYAGFSFLLIVLFAVACIRALGFLLSSIGDPNILGLTVLCIVAFLFGSLLLT